MSLVKYWIYVVLTTTMPLSQSMVWTSREDRKGGLVRKTSPRSHSFSLCCVFFYLTLTLSQSKKNRGRRSYWNESNSLRNHQTLCRSSPSVMGICWDSFCCRILLLFSLEQSGWGQPWSERLFKSELHIEIFRRSFSLSAPYHDFMFASSCWIPIGRVIWVCSLPFSEIAPCWLAGRVTVTPCFG